MGDNIKLSGSQQTLSSVNTPQPKNMPNSTTSSNTSGSKTLWKPSTNSNGNKFIPGSSNTVNKNPHNDMNGGY